MMVLQVHKHHNIIFLHDCHMMDVQGDDNEAKAYLCRGWDS